MAQRDNVLQVRLTPEEREQIASAADKDGRKISDWARWTLLNAVGGIHISPIRDWPELPKELLGSINKGYEPGVFAALESTAKGVGDRKQKPKPDDWDKRSNSDKQTWLRQNR